MGQNKTLRRVGALLVVVALSVHAAAAPATAQSAADSFFDPVVGSDDSAVAWVAEKVVNATGALARYQEIVGERLGLSDDGAASAYADDAAATIEANNATIRSYGNERLEPTQEYDVFVVHFHDRDGGNATRYVVTDVEDNDWTAGPSVLTESEFNATNRTVDHWISLDWYASKHADEEIETFADEFAADGENVTSTHRAKLVSKYGSGLKSDLWGDSSPDFTED